MAVLRRVLRLIVVCNALLRADAFTGYSYFKSKNPKCRSALHPDERARLMDMVNLARKRLVAKQKALYFSMAWSLPMENKSYEDLKKRTRKEKCTLFTAVSDSERLRRYGRRKPAVEFEIMFRYEVENSIRYTQSNIYCKDSNKGDTECYVRTKSKKAKGVLTWLLHYKTTKIGCAGAFCVRSARGKLKRIVKGRRKSSGQHQEKYLKFHCISDYEVIRSTTFVPMGSFVLALTASVVRYVCANLIQEKKRDLLFVKNGWCRSDRRCSNIIDGAYCDNAPTTFITHMCHAPPSPSVTCNEDCRNTETRREGCNSVFHLCSLENMDYRGLMTRFCPRTCGLCGLVDRQQIYPSCTDYTQFCHREELRTDCRKTCYIKEYLARGASSRPTKSWDDGTTKN